MLNKEILAEMIACVKREVSLRYSVYPKLVAQKKMTVEEAEKEKRLMYLVQKSLQKIYDGDAPKEIQQALFDTSSFEKKIYKEGKY